MMRSTCTICWHWTYFISARARATSMPRTKISIRILYSYRNDSYAWMKHTFFWFRFLRMFSRLKTNNNHNIIGYSVWMEKTIALQYSEGQLSHALWLYICTENVAHSFIYYVFQYVPFTSRYVHLFLFVSFSLSSLLLDADFIFFFSHSFTLCFRRILFSSKSDCGGWQPKNQPNVKENVINTHYVCVHTNHIQLDLWAFFDVI